MRRAAKLRSHICMGFLQATFPTPCLGGVSLDQPCLLPSESGVSQHMNGICRMEQCLECGGKDGLHAMFCSAVDTKGLDFGSLIFAYIDGDTAGRRGKPKTPPEFLTEDAQWSWERGWEKGAAQIRVDPGDSL